MQAKSSSNSMQSNRAGRPSSRTMLARCRSPWQWRTRPGCAAALQQGRRARQAGLGRRRPARRRRPPRTRAGTAAGQVLGIAARRPRAWRRSRPGRGAAAAAACADATASASASTSSGPRPPAAAIRSSWASAGKRRISSSHSTGSPGAVQRQPPPAPRSPAARGDRARGRAPVELQLVAQRALAALPAW